MLSIASRPLKTPVAFGYEACANVRLDVAWLANYSSSVAAWPACRLRGGPRYDHPALKGFYMAGQWVEDWGGITTAAQSGRNAVRVMCGKDGVRFAG